MCSDAVIDAADHAMRHWRSSEPGQIKVGSEAHKRLFCRMLLDTHNPYKPAVMLWPTLDDEALGRITSLPIWDIAVQTEGRAQLQVHTYAHTVRDPLLHEALVMDGGEEARHKVVLSKLVEAYGIALAPEPEYLVPKDPQWGWLVTGYSECIDSFFAFGLFESAKRTGYFPAELVDTFEPVVQEEARHILFFANWVAWYRRQLSWWQRLAFEFKVARVWAFLVWERIGIARGLDGAGQMQDANFALTGNQQIGLDLSVGALLDLCLAEDRRRMGGYDQRLLRPTFVPKLARLARRFMRG
ncbi:ferritin-like domain-containing protein [Pseudomonas sp. App30]|uniref:ferritin-like domain-containing protein n=1 Tax=Pseudomonas sp. App30 TaxID=3068990 RepID=UPI003A7F74C3